MFYIKNINLNNYVYDWIFSFETKTILFKYLNYDVNNSKHFENLPSSQITNLDYFYWTYTQRHFFFDNIFYKKIDNGGFYLTKIFSKWNINLNFNTFLFYNSYTIDYYNYIIWNVKLNNLLNNNKLNNYIYYKNFIYDINKYYDNKYDYLNWITHYLSFSEFFWNIKLYTILFPTIYWTISQYLDIGYFQPIFLQNIIEQYSFFSLEEIINKKSFFEQNLNIDVVSDSESESFSSNNSYDLYDPFDN